MDVLKVIPPNYASLQVTVLGEFLDTLDAADDYKAKLDEATKRAMEVAKSTEDSLIATNQANKVRAEQSMQPQPAPGAGGPTGLEALMGALGGGQGASGPAPGEEVPAAKPNPLAPLLAGQK
jgi:hypothetical protein